jgi:hypothetical protein
MKRVIVSVSILLLLLVGIAFLAGAFWISIESQKIGIDPDVNLFYSVVFGLAFIIGSPLCVGAGCLAAWLKPWRSQLQHRDSNGQSDGHSGQPEKVSIMKRVLAVRCYLVGFLLGCISIFILMAVGFSVYDGEELDWGLTAVWFLVPISCILSFVAAKWLWRSDKK